MTALLLLIGCGISFVAGHVYTGWREGIGPFAPRVHVDAETLLAMRRVTDTHPAARRLVADSEPRLRVVGR